MFRKIVLVVASVSLFSGCNSTKEKVEDIEPQPVMSFVSKGMTSEPLTPASEIKKGNVNFHSSRLTGLKLSDISSTDPVVANTSKVSGDNLSLSAISSKTTPKEMPSAVPQNSHVTISYKKGDGADVIVSSLVEAYKLTLSISPESKLRMSMMAVPDGGQMTFKSVENGLDQVLSPLGFKWFLSGSSLTIR